MRIYLASSWKNEEAVIIVAKALLELAFRNDKKWLDWAECVVLLMLSGRSSHLEAGYAVGQGKKLFIYWLCELEKDEFDNMYQFADGMFRSYEFGALVQALVQALTKGEKTK